MLSKSLDVNPATSRRSISCLISFCKLMKNKLFVLSFQVRWR
jgi:hypothetical protein